MSKVPSLHYRKVINALQRSGFVVVRQKGSHIRLQKEWISEKQKRIYGTLISTWQNS